MGLLGGSLLKVARLRAGLTQRDLAERLALPQSSIARWESGARQPTIDNLVEAVRACGLDPVVSLFATDRSNDAFIWDLLDEAPAERLRRFVAAANETRPMVRHEAAQRAGRRTAPTIAAFDPLPVLRALHEGGVQFLLVGRLAEVVRGSPLVPQAEVAVCVESSEPNRARFRAAVQGLGATRWTEDDEQPEETPFQLRQFPRARRWWNDSLGGALASLDVPPGTDGFWDLIRQADQPDLDRELTVPVASHLDLIRMADASIDAADRSGLPTLVRALEFSQDYLPPEDRPLSVPEGLEGLFAEHGLTAS